MKLLLLIALILVNFLTLKEGHNWGDDFAQYIINAQNIIDNRPYGTGVMLDNTVAYPPGFSLVLAPVIKFFGLNFKLFKSLNILFWYLSLIFIYLLLVNIHGKRLASWVVIFLAASSFFFIYKQNVLSDLPFFLFVCASLYAFERVKEKNSGHKEMGWFAIFLFLMSAALWIRSAGVLLFAAAAFYFIFINNDKRKLLIISALFILNECLLYSWMGGRIGFFSAVTQTPSLILHNVLHNFSTLFESIWFFFCPAQTIISAYLFDALRPFVVFSAILVYLTMVWSFIQHVHRKTLSYLECFSFFYASLLIMWSAFPMPPDAFCRFILPLLPFIFTSIFRFVDFLKRFRWNFAGVLRVVFLVLLLFNLMNIAINWNFNDDVFSLPENRQMIDWVKGNVQAEENFMFWKPRALALLTSREGVPPWVFPQERGKFFERVKDFNISYVILPKGPDPQGLAVLLEDNHFNLEWENSSYKIFKYVRAL